MAWSLDGLKRMPGVRSSLVEVYRCEPRRRRVHFDSDLVRMDSLTKLVEISGGKLAGSIERLDAEVVGLRHQRHARVVEETLANLKGVLHVAVGFGTRRLLIELDPAKTILPLITDELEHLGIRIETGRARGPPESSGRAHRPSGMLGERAELVFSVVCGALTAAGWLLAKLHGASVASTALVVAAYGFGGWFVFLQVTLGLWAGKIESDFSMLLAAAGAAVLGEWFEGALLLFLFTLGHAFERCAMGRACRTIEAWADFIPETARVLKAGQATEVPVELLAVGDRVLVQPRTRVPVDGFVEHGAGSIDQSPVTGESVSVHKSAVLDVEAALRNPAQVPGVSRVFAGTLNGASALTVCVTKIAGESTLSRITEMVTRAMMHKCATQVFADRFERIFTPTILALVLVLFLAWIVGGEPFATSFYRAMAVLVAASPCALAIATPSAVLSGVARAALGGVLVKKGGAHLEALAMVNVIVFDKTGTLTEGPKLTDVEPMPGIRESGLLASAAAIAQRFDHPLARALAVGAVERLPQTASLPDVLGAEAIMGSGMRATIEGVPVRIGKPGLFTGDTPGLPDLARKVASLEERGRTVMLLEVGREFLGVLGFKDPLRPAARSVLAALRELGIQETVMLTDDNQKVADAIAKELGLRQAKGDLLPEQKIDEVAAMALRFRRVAMVGDGVHDAHAMSNATLGITIGAGRSDVALETADVALMADELAALPFAIGLSRAARRIIRQNLFASLGMVAILIPATVLDFVGIGLAVALHEGSLLIIMANALRLLSYSGPELPVQQQSQVSPMVS